MSLSIGLSGLRATNESLGVISHNIANVSTAGFKSARAEFSAVYGGGQAGGTQHPLGLHFWPLRHLQSEKDRRRGAYGPQRRHQ